MKPWNNNNPLLILLITFYFLSSSAIIITNVSAKSYKIPFREHPSSSAADNYNFPSSSALDDFQTYFYEQTLDHFNYGSESYLTFEQKYMINTKYWNVGRPIFVHLGAEAPLNTTSFGNVGFLNYDLAPRFHALLVFIEVILTYIYIYNK